MIGNATQIAAIFRPLIPWYLPYVAGMCCLGVGKVVMSSCDGHDKVMGIIIFALGAPMVISGPILGYLPG